MTPSADFAESIAANIAYWQTRLREPNDDEIKAVDLDRINLYRAIEFGMGLPVTWHETANLVVQCFPFIVQRGYYRDWIPVLEKLTSGCAQDDLALKGWMRRSPATLKKSGLANSWMIQAENLSLECS